MEADARVTALTNKHAALEQAIAEESQRPMPDSLEISRLKREKLLIKDEIARLRRT